MRKEVIGNATLYLGDCREILPTLNNFDVCISDPPYGIEDLVGGYSRDGATIKNDRNLDCCFQALNIVVSLKKDIRICAFYSCRISRDFFARSSQLGDYVGEIVWDKKAPGMGGPIRYQHENVAIFEQGKPPPMGETFSVIVDMRSPTLHPHQKPQTLMQKLCNIANGKIVLDPFMGSGSTGCAALATGRSFIGVELDEKHFDTACKRISEASKQESIF